MFNEFELDSADAVKWRDKFKEFTLVTLADKIENVKFYTEKCGKF